MTPTAASEHCALPIALSRATGRALAAAVVAISTLGVPLVAHAEAGIGQVETGVSQVAGAVAAPALPATVALENRMLQLVNADRAANGQGPLEFDPSLLPTARARAEAQKPLPSLSHFDSSGRLVFTGLLKQDGITFQLAGENLARLPGLDDGTASRAEEALMRSPTHRANILESTFSRIAIGATVDEGGRVILAQIFRAL